MTAEKKNAPTEGASENPTIDAADAAEKDVTDTLIETFEQILDRDGKEAYGRWGFALFHSMKPEKAIQEMQRLGMKPRHPYDHYNLGCVLAQKEKYSDAAKEFEQAVKMDPEMDAARYNLALAREKAGELGGAKKIWNDLLQRLEGTEEAAEIKSHLAELAGK